MPGYGYLGRRTFHLHSAILAASRYVAIRGLILLAAALVTRDPSFASGVTRFLARPLVRRAFLMSGLPALTGDLPLLRAVHRRKTTIFLCHVRPPPRVPRVHKDRQPGQCNRCAC